MKSALTHFREYVPISDMAFRPGGGVQENKYKFGELSSNHDRDTVYPWIPEYPTPLASPVLSCILQTSVIYH